jgi:hypothetical protein
MGGLELGVAHLVHDGAEVGAAGQQPGCVSPVEVVEPGLPADAEGSYGG